MAGREMNWDLTGSGNRHAEFPSTQWSALVALNDPSHPAFQKQLSNLIEQYWKPAYSYLRNLQRGNPEEAKDLTQAFFARLLEKRYLEHLSEERGGFRGFLKTALKNFSINAARAERARLPKGEARLFRFDQVEAEWQRLAPASQECGPEEAFDREWARQTLMECVQVLEQRLRQEGKELSATLFREFYLETSGVALRPEATSHLTSDSSETVSYQDLATRHRISGEEVRYRLRDGRNRLKQILKERIQDYLAPGEDPKQELAYLLSK